MNKNIGPFRRRLKRLTTKKGSVLFFVIAIMSVLIVMASALFYAVNSARQEVEAKYSNEQAYQSAIGINDMVSDYIAADPNAEFVDAMFALTKGDSLKTTISDLGAGIGNVKVTITKISGDAESAILSITTESEVNGQLQVVTSVGELTEGKTEEEPASLARFFTSTGYVPNDTLFSSGEVTSELYLDSEYTELAGQQGSTGGFNILADIISSGSIRFNNAPINGGGTAGKTINITIGNDCYFYYAAGLLDLGGGTLRVGGSVVQLANCYAFNKNTNVYIQKDLYSGTAMGDNDGQRLFINGNLVVADSFNYNGEIFVNGDMYLDKDFNQGIFAGKLHVGGNVYVDKNSGLKANQLTALNSFADIKGKIIESEVPVDFNLSTSYTVYEAEDMIESIIKGNSSQNGGVAGYTYIWPSKSSDSNPCESMDTVTEMINQAIGTSNYINWDLDKVFHIGEDVNNPYIETTDLVYPFKNDGQPYPFTITLSAKDTNKYIIQNIDVQRDYSAHALVFDTDDGNGGFKDIYVMLKPNVKYDANTRKITYPEYVSKTITDTFPFECPGKMDDGSSCDGTALDYTGRRLEKSEQYLECKNCKQHFEATGIQSWQDGQDFNQYNNYTEYPADFVCTNCSEPITQFVTRYIQYPAVNHFECTKCGHVIETDANQWIDGEQNGDWLINNVDMFKTVTETRQEMEKVTPDSELNGFQFGDTVPNFNGTAPNNGMPFHVFVKGKGSVIFVVPKGETYVARGQSYVGHYALYKEITGDSIEAAEGNNGYASSNDGAEKLKGLESDTVNYDSKLGLFKQPLIDKYGDSGEKLYLHNNIFLASVEKNVNVDFDVDETIFAGLLYAPYMQYTSTSGASNRILFGGLVVSNYTLQGSAKYLYAAPYDYYDVFVKPEDMADPEKHEAERNKYLAHLMGTTGSDQYLENGGGGALGRAWNRFGYN